MKLRNLFKKKENLPDRLHDARMEAIRKDIESSDKIIEMMKRMNLNRRAQSVSFDGPERRNA